jgi:hypothetical protein
MSGEPETPAYISSVAVVGTLETDYVVKRLAFGRYESLTRTQRAWHCKSVAHPGGATIGFSKYALASSLFWNFS